MIAICDEAVRSDVEAGVFTLESVRYDVLVESFPHVREVSVYLLLSHYRAGTFNWEVRLIHNATRRTVRLRRFTVAFDGEHPETAEIVELGTCTFPVGGIYDIEVVIVDEDGRDRPRGDSTLRLVS